MKIAYVVEPRKVIGGGVRAAMNLSKSMKNLYKAMTVIFGVYENTVEDKAVDFYTVNTLKPMSFFYWRQYHCFVKGYKPDIVHCLGLYTALVCLLHKKITHSDYAIVCTVHRVTMNMRYVSLIKYVVSYIARNLDYTTFLTEYQKEHYFKNVGFCPNKFVIVPNVIFVQNVSEEEKRQKRIELANELNAEFLTSYVGRIIPSKNIEDTIRITAMVNECGLNLGCVLVGGSEREYYEKLQALIEELNIGNKVKFVGYVNTPSLYTGATDFTITTTTHGEALPNLLIESYALEKVTFSSDIPQMVNLIDHETNGYTLSLKDLNMFINKIRIFCTDEELRKRMENAALDTYKRLYSHEYVTSIYNHVYQSI